MQIRQAQNSDQESLSDVLSRAFAEDPVMRWLVPDETAYERISGPFFSHILKQNFPTGTSFTNQDLSGVSLWSAPGHRPGIFSQLQSFLKVFFWFRPHLDRAIALQHRMESYRPRKPFWHLTYIATVPEKQGSGIGGRLLEPILNAAELESKPIYLECSNQKNLSFYRSHGFRLLDKIAPPNGPVIWPMIKDA